MSSSTICKNFVQNAWKKELCSNCFKSKDEHDKQLQKLLGATKATANTTKKGIIKSTKSALISNKFKRRVKFSNDICKVIGYGGDDWFECSDSDEDDAEAAEEQDTQEEEEEEAEVDDPKLEELTKTNTDYNVYVGTNRKLQLGKPLVDSSGRKQTLQVQVTPFGQSMLMKPKVDTTAVAPVVKQFLAKTTKVEEKSLLDEIDETLNKTQNTATTPSSLTDAIICKTSTVPTESAAVVTKPSAILFKTTAINMESNAIEKTDKEVSESVKTEDKVTTEEENSDESEDSLKAPYENIISSRELAGEPDGSSASDENDKEPPSSGATTDDSVKEKAIEADSSVTNSNNNNNTEKPKIPTKPSTILIRKPYVMNTVNKVILSTFSVSDKSTNCLPKSPVTPSSLVRRDSTGSDNGKKRKAPKPPEEYANNIYTRRTPPTNPDCPVVREKEKRERASSTPKLRPLPEPAPRHSLSVSTDSLNEIVPGDKKKRNRFSLKKFLRMGSSNGLRDSCESIAPPMPKPRLVIVHPTDLPQCETKQRPPPPPRAHNLLPPSSIPNPLPPKSIEVKELQSTASMNELLNQRKPTDSVYANIGEVRLAIAPNKPQRTASMREREASINNKNRTSSTGYEDLKGDNHVYEYVNGNGNNSNRSSSPEYDTYDGPQVRVKNHHHQTVVASAMLRSASLTYCGSETESEIYAPYSSCYYGSESEQVADDEREWNHTEGRTYKLRSRKGRSIVHKNLEDNYGAVVIANHEALAQVLDNIQHNNYGNHLHIMRTVKSIDNLRWTNFVLKNTKPCIIGPCAFHEAFCNSQAVVLMISTLVATSPSLSLGTFQLHPVTEFSDLIPMDYTAQSNATPGIKIPKQATIAVLPHVQVDSITSVAERLKIRSEQHLKDSAFLLLQLVNALKTLQAQGIEELPLNLNTFVLTKEFDKPDLYRKLHILLGDESGTNKANATLCMIANTVLDKLPVDIGLGQLIRDILQSERAVSLSQVKSILEFSLWGPSDVLLGNTSQEREVALQRWLDLQRATVLHGLVCTKVQLTVYEECHLLFLVRSNAKIMREASLLLESVRRS